MFIFQWHLIKGDIDGFNKNYVAVWCYLAQDYPNLARLAQALLVFPYSSASVESSFSKLKGYKTLYRNRLLVGNLEASMLIQQRDLKEKDFEVTAGMKEKYYNMWKKDTEDSKPHQTSNSTNSSQEESNLNPCRQNLKAKERLSQIFQSFLTQIDEMSQNWIMKLVTLLLIL